MSNRFTLTESEKERILNMHKKEHAKNKNVIKEQPTEVNYEQISNELKGSLMGETSFFIPPGGGSPYGFKIENISVPQDVTKGRTIAINGLSGVVGNNKYIQSPDAANLIIEYTCKTSLNQDSNKPIDGSSNLIVNPPKEGLKNGVGMINKDLANFIETSWCQKLPYHSGGGGRFMSTN